MADKEIRIPFSEIKDPQKITGVNVRRFKESGLDIHKNDVQEIADDPSAKTRVLKIRNRKYFDMGRRSAR